MVKGIKVPNVLLNSSHEMPVLGFGTAFYPIQPVDEVKSILLDAIEVGYRHFDTASIYGTEEAVGQAIKEALKLGLIKERSEVFITSKLWCTDAQPHLVVPALYKTLEKLRMNYVDLYLIHWPITMKNTENNPSKDDILPFDTKGIWDMMETCYQTGLAKSIGVSNFSCAKLSTLLEHATIIPAVNQVEMNVAWRQRKMLRFCYNKLIHVSAWSPLGNYNSKLFGSLAVVENKTLKSIATNTQKSVAQVALRWVFKQGASVIVKSCNKERMKENMQIFDWTFIYSELAQIEQIPEQKTFAGDWFVRENGPYKSVEELWDGEI